MLHSQPTKNDQSNSRTQLHRQNKQLPLATSCQEQQNGCGSSSSQVYSPGNAGAAAGAPSHSPLPSLAPLLGAAHQGCTTRAALLPPSLVLLWPHFLRIAKIICTHTTKQPAAYSGEKQNKKEQLCTLI